LEIRDGLKENTEEGLFAKTRSRTYLIAFGLNQLALKVKVWKKL
jgi:translation elongation factor EF-1beta